MTDAQKTAYNLARADVNSGDPERVKRGQGVLAQYGENELHGARMKELLTKEKAQKGLRKDLEDKYKADGLTGAALNDAVKNDFDNVMKQHIAMSQTDEGKAFLQLSSEEKDSIEDTMTANPHLIEPKAGQTKEDAIKAHFQAMEDKKRLNVGAISAGSFTGNGPDDLAARAALQSFKREGKDGKKVSLWSEMESGKGTSAQRKAIIGLISAADVASATGATSVASLVRAGAVGDKDADGTSTTRRQEVINRIQAPGGGGLPTSTRGAAAAALLDTKDYTPEQVFGNSFATLENDIPATSDIAVGAAAMVTADTASARHLSSVVKDGAAPSAATLAIASAVTRDDVKRLRGIAANQAGTDEGDKANQALDVISRAVEIEQNNANAGEDHKKRMKGISDELVGRRYGRGTPGGGGGGGTAAGAAAAGAAAAAAAGAAAGAAAPAVQPAPRTRGGGRGGGGGGAAPAAGPTPTPGPGPGPAPAGGGAAPAAAPASKVPKPPKPAKKNAPAAAPAAPAPAASAPAPAAPASAPAPAAAPAAPAPASPAPAAAPTPAASAPAPAGAPTAPAQDPAARPAKRGPGLPRIAPRSASPSAPAPDAAQPIDPNRYGADPGTSGGDGSGNP